MRTKKGGESLTPSGTRTADEIGYLEKKGFVRTVADVGSTVKTVAGELTYVPISPETFVFRETDLPDELKSKISKAVKARKEMRA